MTTFGIASRFNSMTMRMPSLFDSSRMSEMSSIFFSLTNPGDVLDQRRFVHVVRNLADDDAFLAAFDFLDADAPAHFDAAAPGQEVILDALLAADQATGREVGRP